MKNQKPKYKIIPMGRSGVGKDFFATLLEEMYGYSQLRSYTTRPRRTPTENTHVFINDEQANQLTDRVAETLIDTYQYFATREQFMDCDIYTLDPKGLYSLKEHAPEVPVCVIYVEASPEIRLQRAKDRAADPVKAEEIFKSRTASENEQFSDFEELIKNEENFAKEFPNVRIATVFNNNTATREDVVAFLEELNSHL